MRVITQYDGSIGQETVILNQLGSKQYAQEKFLAVRLVHNSDEVRYAELKIYMHNSYVNSEELCLKTLSAALNVLANCKGGKRPSSQKYEARKDVALITKGDTIVGSPGTYPENFLNPENKRA